MVAVLAFVLAVAPALASAAVYDVQVGANGLVYTPEYVNAVAGDVVTFHFNPKNHTVTQSSLANPCSFNQGINSGFVPVAAGTTPLPTFSITVNDTTPVWLYCAQGARTPGSHCGQGMVFAINCGADGAANSFANFKKAAMDTLPSNTTTTPVGGVTLPPAPTPSLVTQVVSLGSSVWTTTYSSYPNSPGPTPASEDGEVHKVIVGPNGTFTFDPEHVIARPRDRIIFEFRQKNHTATQSSFDSPCAPFNDNGVAGFDSGFMPVADGVTAFPNFTFTVTSTGPTYVYCRQGNHCKQGMVFGINLDDSGPRNFQAFKNRATSGNGTVSSSSGTPSSTATNSTSDASQVKVGFLTSLSLMTFLGFAL